MITVTSISHEDPSGGRSVLVTISADGTDTDPAFLVMAKNSVTAENADYSDAEFTAVASIEDMELLPVTAGYPDFFRSATAQLVFPDETTEDEVLTSLTADLGKAITAFRSSHLDEEMWSVSASCTASAPACAQKLRRYLDRKHITVPENSSMPRYILNMLPVHERPFQEKPEPSPVDDPNTRGLTGE